MTPIDIQVSRSKVSVEGQAYSLYVGEGGISVLQTAIFLYSMLVYKIYAILNLEIVLCRIIFVFMILTLENVLGILFYPVCFLSSVSLFAC